MQNSKWHHNPSLDITPSLPPETSIGLRHLHFVDSSRDDISTGKREFMASVFYRADTDVAAPRARLTDILQPHVDEALELLSKSSGLAAHEKAAVFSRLIALTLRAQRDLRPQCARSPVLIFYPGGQGHRLANSALCESLACNGYIVFALDAPRDAPVVVFPDGRMVTPPAPDDESYIWPRVADVRHLLNELETLNSAGPLAGFLDLSRIGMFGHSRGGYLSNICAVEDERISAACNMDGFYGVSGWQRAPASTSIPLTSRSALARLKRRSYAFAAIKVVPKPHNAGSRKNVSTLAATSFLWLFAGLHMEISPQHPGCAARPKTSARTPNVLRQTRRALNCWSGY
jgi:hypothetical protein